MVGDECKNCSIIFFFHLFLASFLSMPFCILYSRYIDVLTTACSPAWDIIPPKDHMTYTLTFLGVCSRVTSSEKSLLTKLSEAEYPNTLTPSPCFMFFYSTFHEQVLIYWFVHLFLSIFSVRVSSMRMRNLFCSLIVSRAQKSSCPKSVPLEPVLIRRMISCIYIIHFTFREHLLLMGICAFEGLLVKN